MNNSRSIVGASRISTAFASVLFMGLLSCSEHSNSNDPNEPYLSPPIVGRTYTYLRHDIDSSLAPLPSTADSIVYTVASSAAAIEGKKTAVLIIDDQSADSSYYIFYTRGKLEYLWDRLGNLGIGKRWVTFDLDVTDDSTLIVEDIDIIDTIGQARTLTLNLSWRVEAIQTLAVKGIPYDSYRISIKTYLYDRSIEKIAYYDELTLWYAWVPRLVAKKLAYQSHLSGSSLGPISRNYSEDLIDDAH